MSACLLCGLDGRDVETVLGFLRELPARLPEFLLVYGWQAGAAAVAGLSALAAARRLVGRFRHARLEPGARLVEISSPPQADPKGALVFWNQLAGLLRPAWKRLAAGQPHLVWEYAGDESGVRIRLWVPGGVPPGMVEKAVEAAWPGAALTTGPATSPLPEAARVAGGRLVLSRSEHLPLKTDHHADPVRSLLTAMSGLRTGEQALVQILARPTTGRRLRRAHRAAAALRGARTASPIGQVLDELAPMSGHDRPGELARMFPERAEQVRAILAKASQPRYQVAVRYAVASTLTTRPVSGWLRGQAHTLAGAFALFSSGHQYLRRRRLLRPAKVLVSRRLDAGHLLSAGELAALAHLPWDADAPGITRAGARPVAPSPAVPRGSAAGPVRVLGDADSGPARPVAMPVADARHHVHVLGGTGVGKSTLLANLVLADAEAGRGALVIDPKGDLITDVLARLPSAAIGRTVVFDPQDAARPPAINVLAGPDPAFAVDSIVTIFHRCFSSAWGPRVDDLLRSTCLTLTKVLGQRATLADVPRLLTDSAYRARITARLDDELLAGFWESYQALTPAGQATVIGPVMNKLRAVLLRPFIRHALASPSTTVPVGQLLNDGGLVLARLPKGILGDDAARLFGSVLLAHTWQAATGRARLAEADRADAALYIDECHNFLNLPGHINDVLAEARGYRLSLVLAHQHLDQLPADLREALSADARNKIYFAASPKDASDLKAHTAPLITPHDLIHLGAFQAAARLVVAGRQTPAFTLRTRPLPPVVSGREQAVRRASRERFSVPAPTGGAERKRRRRAAGNDPRATHHGQ
ncbi:type IV secretion system DNA-binding domain-containing protein [Planomonospora sp. ID91781]|uniref:type IV secretory system conjugative DNA transfer family protein n=1 Tax=Planomonospora sp. ID91781 TaxID=2738135 RepID=UPI0018C37CBB|nr:type IV secretion system DNA-binding domain-containing protein [Planomonospora sp. ID91781]MBG0824893.1 type IV secretion system DNA-binding domain-containing protein [Planomonospora sp. ID91781]